MDRTEVVVVKRNESARQAKLSKGSFEVEGKNDERGKYSNVTGPVIVVTSSDLAMNKLAHDLFGNPEEVLFLYNKTTSQFGFAEAPGESDAYKVFGTEGAGLRRISCARPAKKFRLFPPKGISHLYKVEVTTVSIGGLDRYAVITTGEQPQIFGK